MASAPKRMCIRSPTTILDLNDYVLRKVFSHLNDFNLCSVANVCSSFKRNAHKIFLLRHTEKRYDIVIIPWRNYRKRLQRLPSILQTFGFLIKSLVIYTDTSFCDLTYCVLESVGRYCNQTLIELCLQQFAITADIISLLRPLLGRLKTLELERCVWESESPAIRFKSDSFLVEIVRCASRLRELKFDRWYAELEFNENLYMKILNVVSTREPKCPLQIILPESFVTAPIELRMANKNMVHIKFGYFS